MSGTKLNKKLIIQSFIEELDAQSQRELTEWMSADSANADRYNEWKIKWEKGEITAQWENIDLEENWERIIQKSETGKKSDIQYHEVLKYAAAAAILIFIGFWWLSQNTLTELSNEEKITQSFVLPDETEIWLKPGSSIRFDEVGFLDDRSVSLLGEGYFEVRKGQIPFVVTTGDAAIEVLGTVFNVKGKDRTADVALIEGSIKFYSKDQEMILSPCEQVMFDGSQIRKVSQSFNENEIGWKTKYS
ncbi:MAG: FecR family protein, partial [Bacteroidota bacterium]